MTQETQVKPWGIQVEGKVAQMFQGDKEALEWFIEQSNRADLSDQSRHILYLAYYEGRGDFWRSKAMECLGNKAIDDVLAVNARVVEEEVDSVGELNVGE